MLAFVSARALDICDLDQICIRSFTSLSLQTLQRCKRVIWPLNFQINAVCSGHQMSHRGRWAAFSPTLEPSRARLAYVPGRPSVNALSSVQPESIPENVAGVNGQIMWPLVQLWRHLHYNTTMPRSALCSVRAERGLMHLYLLSRPDFNEKFCVIIAADTSSVCYISRLKLSVPDSRWRTNDAEPLSALLGAEPNTARFCPETAKCKALPRAV